MTSPLDKALKRLAELQREMAEIKSFIDMYHRFEADSGDTSRVSALGDSREQLTGNNAAEGSIQSVDNSAGLPGRRIRLQGATPKEIADLMERVIREADRPMSRGEIVDALERRDVEINAHDKSRYIGTIAWRNKGKFINIEGRGYWLRDALPYAPGVPPLTRYSDPPEEHSDELFPE